MLEIPDDRCERHRLFQAIDDAFKAGDLEALKLALGNSPSWFDEPMPHELGLGHPLQHAIYWSPLGFIDGLIAAGSSVNYEDAGGFPALIAALSTDRHGRSAWTQSGLSIAQRPVPSNWPWPGGMHRSSPRT